MARPLESECEYVLDHEYADRQRGANEFHRWLGIKNAGGMRPIYRTHRSKGVSAKDLAALVLVSRQIPGAGYNPWEDIVDRDQGRIWYWGDAKAHKTKSRDGWTGNQYLTGIADLIAHDRWSEVPPILHFSKVKAGMVHFNGVCVLADLADAWFEDAGKRVRNYRATLDILPVERVPLAWIDSRRAGSEFDAPEPWALYAAYSGRTRAPIPETSGHRFRTIRAPILVHPGTDSGPLGH